eukprot:CAMPEP_0168508504 /NCGR_PEP_ID=MMETSP0405-20121227/164_1 /TAXON_ID=498012 /ORGANISM="Trichosphaerium sp, Strain Am-I-7 wt" /LENGTH=320 /DNA_ID=CAMNT_0008525673 /DNA_START=115 /DNA_END=1077 /DNA_ORIENTATION=-
MKGLGTRETNLSNVWIGKDAFKREKIIKAYKKCFPERDLIKDIKKETSGDYETILCALATPIWEYKATYLHDAMNGVGTKEKALIDVLAYSTNIELRRIKEEYARVFSGQPVLPKGDKPKEGTVAPQPEHNNANQLEIDIRKDTSHNFEKCLIELCRATRNEKTAVDPAAAAHDADMIYKKGEGRFGTNDKFFIQLMTTRSREHLAAVSDAYKAKHGHDLITAIKKETSGYYKKLLVALCTTHAEYFAHRLHDAIDRLGTDDSALIFSVVSHDPAQREAIDAKYLELFKKPLPQAVKDDTSGDYGRLCYALMTGDLITKK